MTYDNLLLAVEGRVATLTVNRPDKRNALDTATVNEMHRALDEVRAAKATVLIITGAGEVPGRSWPAPSDWRPSTSPPSFSQGDRGA